MSDIYDLHDAAFAQVAAYVITKGGDRVATIAFKFPPKGHGERRTWAYVHWFGTDMVRGYTGGGGYDKKSAAVAQAARKFIDATPSIDVPQRAYWAALAEDGSRGWESALRAAGFGVLSAV